MIFEHKIGVKGRFKACVYRADGTLKYESGWSSNIVTNLGVQMLLGGASVAPSATSVNLRCSCGSGNNPPLATDTQIQSFIAGTTTTVENSTTRNSTVSPYYVMHMWKYRFAAGVATGNVSELCVVNANTTPNASSPAFSRALVRDAGGSPTTITILPDESLDVTYELYLYPASSDVTGSFNQMIDGVSTPFTYTIRASNIQQGGGIGSSSGWAMNSTGQIATIYAQTGSQSSVYTVGGALGGVGSTPTGTSNSINGPMSSATGNYSLKYRDLTFVAGLSDANVSFDCIRFACNLCCYQMQISPAVTKVGTKTYSITIRVTLDNTV